MTLHIDLNPDYLNIIKAILRNPLPLNAKIWLFGSRTKGIAKPFSDIDLLIDINRPLTLKEMTVLNHAFDESLLPYKVDLADFASIGVPFKNAIKDQLVPITLDPDPKCSISS